jgi:Tir chaperone protein (CesT) family
MHLSGGFMLPTFIPKLIKDMDLGNMNLASDPGTYALPLDEGISIKMIDIPGGYILKSNIGAYPKVKEDLFLTQAMLGNLFGQGTKGAVLGLNPEGTLITLTLVVDSAVDYKEFKESLEDFINVIDFWREEASNPTPLK